MRDNHPEHSTFFSMHQLVRVPVFQQGYMDGVKGKPYADEYETANESVQHVYELGRYFAAYAGMLDLTDGRVFMAKMEEAAEAGIFI